MSQFKPTEDERTTEVGLYHYARSYQLAADNLSKGPPPPTSTHPEAPTDFLYAHAIELYLKAFLKLEGMTVADLKKVGHDIPDLAKRVMQHGVILDTDVCNVLDLLNYENVFGSRYIKTGPYRRASTAGLEMTANTLHNTVRGCLRDRGRVCAD
jgi:hypothetical protein